MTNDMAVTPVELDGKVNRLFAGKVVRKDLVRKVKVGANVPVFVLEYLLGKYCASSDEVSIQMGLQVVNDTLANNYIRADESMKAQAIVSARERTTERIRDMTNEPPGWGCCDAETSSKVGAKRGHQGDRVLGGIDVRSSRRTQPSSLRGCGARSAVGGVRTRSRGGRTAPSCAADVGGRCRRRGRLSTRCRRSA